MFLYHPQPGRKDPRVLGPLNPPSLSETSQDPLLLILVCGGCRSDFCSCFIWCVCSYRSDFCSAKGAWVPASGEGYCSSGGGHSDPLVLPGAPLLGFARLRYPPGSFGLYRLTGTVFGIPSPWTRAVNSSGGLASVLTLCHCGAATHRRTALIGLTRCKRYANWRGISGRPLLWRIRTPNPPAKGRSTSCLWGFTGLQGHSCPTLTCVFFTSTTRGTLSVL